MAIINNNVENVKFLRNQNPYLSREAAREALEANKGNAVDGSALLARYTVTDDGVTSIKTLVGFVAESGNTKYLTIIDVEGGSADVQELREEINAKLGEGITSENTATEQLAALSGDTFVPGTSSSADTSVEGAKAYAYDLIGTLDYADTAETGSYVSEVTQSDGKIISTTKVALPTVNAISETGKPITAVSETLGAINASAGTIDSQYVDVTGFTATNVQGALEEIENDYKTAISGLDYSDSAVAKNFVKSVSETDGVIAVERGSITSSGKTIVLTDNADGGVNFEANVDGTTIIVDENTGVMSVASSALVQYEGDGDTIQISAVQDGVRTVSSPLTIQKVTTGLSAEVKEEYHLVGASGTTIGDPVKIYKDSHIVSIDYIDDPADEHYQNLEYVYVNDSGATSTTYVDMSELVLEAEFASGITVTNHVAHGVVDPASEAFLTVGADGFKLSGVTDAINSAVDALDADVSGNSTHVTVGVEEVNGVITAVTVSEDNIANADDLEELSGKTITAITSTNSSITTSINDATGNKTVDIQTDASKIKMSGFTSTDALSGITEDDSIVDAFEEVDRVITENEETTSAALTDLDERLDTIESGYVETVKVNNVALTETNNTVNIEVESATSAMTATNGEAIVVDTDANGGITLGISSIDCGYYS